MFIHDNLKKCSDSKQNLITLERHKICWYRIWC